MTLDLRQHLDDLPADTWLRSCDGEDYLWDGDRLYGPGDSDEEADWYLVLPAEVAP